MANVIPEKMRHDIARFERARFILVGAAAALICAGIAFVLLIPSFLMVVIDTGQATPDSTIVSSKQQTSDAGALAHTNALLAVLAPIAQTGSTPTAIIADALALRPAGVRIDQIMYHAGSPSTLMLTGAADTSGEINVYQTTLSADPHFTSVSIPVGALVGADGGRFSITLAGAF